MIELRARFDENATSLGARAGRGGVHVGTAGGLKPLQGFAVVRREGDAIRRYVHCRRNYNPLTARHLRGLRFH